MSFAQPHILEPKSYVGFDTITTQIEHRLLKKGFQFNILVAGYSGLGKSTLINTLFSNHLVDSQGRRSANEPIGKTSEITVSSHQLVENNVRLNVNVIDTPGFGDQINNDKCWEPIVRYIKEQYSLYLRKELTAVRERHIQDTRVHAVLYFIQPNNIGLRALDIIALKKLSEISNVIPVIAKADTLTLDERETFRKTLQKEFEFHDLNLYPFDSEDLLDEERELNNSIKSIIPFAVIGSETDITIDGQVFKGRRTRWGTINVEDIEQSEFVYLRDFLTRTHLQDLIETTAYVHYENFRSKQLTTLKENASSSARASAHISGVPMSAQNGVPAPGAVNGSTAYKQRP
ncbi:CYFA0S19e01926g1_1 [Cyberlindnera fabianii]|uniref:Cell division control protein 10 n=1 Tax=Cyberlindnera fabianii TaxID=36022 RepID=A0A061BFD8_CYBFA|nr:Cell division control protein 10 [Cyberlindnera fabianii]CDR45696.1 CYFA0S19e01926g1_1 [Cyberlindnera fabianii]